MSAQSKQQADLVRHRELNALRRLMGQRGKTESSVGESLATQQTSVFEASKAIGKIDELEAQMNRQMFAKNSAFDGRDFQLTQIQAIDSSTANTTRSMTSLLPEQSSPVQLAGEHFANGKSALAQEVLEHAISRLGQQYDHVPTWLALLDLYSASDQVDKFEAAALDFSIRFGRSPPQWLSLPQQAAQAEREHDQTIAADNNAVDWSAKATLTQDDLVALKAAVQAAIKAPHQLKLNWLGYVPSDVQNWHLLQAALQYLATMPVMCAVQGIAEMELMFDPNSAESTLAELALLRCQNRAQAFEDLAINYSMQFEISPPDWIRPECRFEVAHLLSQPVVLAPELTSMSAELYGVLDAAHVVKQLAKITAQDGLVIRCDRLVRCDPVAVMAIRRFVQAAKEKRQTIEFKGVHRVLAAFLMAQQVSDFAKIHLRKD